jgi:hypothetical protein
MSTNKDLDTTLSPTILRYLKDLKRKSRKQKTKWVLAPTLTVSGKINFWVQDQDGNFPLAFLYPNDPYHDSGFDNEEYGQVTDAELDQDDYSYLRHRLLQVTSLVSKESPFPKGEEPDAQV